jgi:DNA-binding LacI/PurR family transcriptional regulator
MSPAIGTPPEDILVAEQNGLPAVLIARNVEGAGVPVFRGDDAYGTALATNHLISLGHKRIAMIGGTDQTSTGRDRYQGYATPWMPPVSRSSRVGAFGTSHQASGV